MTTQQSNGQVKYLIPEGLHHNPAFTDVVTVSGPVTTVYVGGQNAVTPDGQVTGKDDLAAQTEQIFANLETALGAAGATIDHVIKWTIYVVEGQAQQIGAAFGVYQQRYGPRPNPPLISVVIVAGLANPDFLAELEAVAVIPQ